MRESILKAIYVGNLVKVNELLDDSVNAFYVIPWKERESIICETVNSKRLDIAKLLIKRGCQKGDIEGESMPFYRTAMLYGDVELVTLLLDMHPEYLNKSYNGETLLHLAVSENLEHMVQLLIDYEANINVPNSDGLFPINIAAKRGNLMILKLLLNKGASVETKSLQTGRTSLFYALESGSKDVVTLLLDNGANCNVKSDDGKTTLHFSMARIQTGLTKMLIDAGADVEQRNSIGQTPLHVACMLGSSPLIHMLLNAGADINATDIVGLVPTNALQRRRISPYVFMRIPVTFLLIKHLILLRECGLYVHRRNERFYCGFMNRYHLIGYLRDVHTPSSDMVKNNLKSSKEELCILKEIKSNSTTCYDVLRKLNNPLSIATESEIKLLELAVNGNKCPMYEVVLRASLKHAKQRISLFTEAQHSLSIIINDSKNKLPSIPEEMNRYIVSYLKNDELDQFIKSVC